MKIESVEAYAVLDSRGLPTVEVEVRVPGGLVGRGVAPSGASTGASEALELRDADRSRYAGKGVERAIENVNRTIAPDLQQQDCIDQRVIDARLIALDGTSNKARLGANAIVAVSMAVAAVAAKVKGVALFEHLGGGTLIPMPQIQIVGGGAHAAGRTDLQDFLVIPIAARTYEEALRIVFDVHHEAIRMAHEQNRYTGVADEGGLFPNFDTNESVLAFVTDAIRKAGYEPKHQAGIALDIAATGFWDRQSARYELRLDRRSLSTAEMIEQVQEWCNRYPIVSIEDPLDEEDWEGWRALTSAIGSRVQIIGDDLFTTNAARIARGVADRCANAVLIKLNQIGTVSETIDTILQTQRAGWRPIVSARSGETEDTFIAHLAVGTSAGQIKVGSLTRSERTAKWNELTRISRQLGGRATFAANALRMSSGS